MCERFKVFECFIILIQIQVGLYHSYFNTWWEFIDPCGLCNQGNIIDSHSKGHTAQERIDIKETAATEIKTSSSSEVKSSFIHLIVSQEDGPSDGT